MSLEKTDALVIRQVDFSESSRVVTFFSRDFGRFSALAKGAKRLRGPFDAALDLLSECRVVFIKKSHGTLNLLTEARLSKRFQPQATGALGALSGLYAGYYVAELLAGLTEDFDPAPSVYELTQGTLENLSDPDESADALVIRFEVVLLQQIGLFPNLSECSVCGSSVSSDSKFAHWVCQGGILCANCRREEYAGARVSAGSIEILRRLTESDSPDHRLKLSLSHQQAQECHRIAVSAITHAMGRRPATLRYIQI
ncbi:MAG: DNA repair protein RecO [Planctomycetota bacterium]